jgi:hypothetical protein
VVVLKYDTVSDPILFKVSNVNAESPNIKQNVANTSEKREVSIENRI